MQDSFARDIIYPNQQKVHATSTLSSAKAERKRERREREARIRASETGVDALVRTVINALGKWSEGAPLAAIDAIHRHEPDKRGHWRTLTGSEARIVDHLRHNYYRSSLRFKEEWGAGWMWITERQAVEELGMDPRTWMRARPRLIAEGWIIEEWGRHPRSGQWVKFLRLADPVRLFLAMTAACLRMIEESGADDKFTMKIAEELREEKQEVIDRLRELDPDHLAELADDPRITLQEPVQEDQERAQEAGREDHQDHHKESLTGERPCDMPPLHNHPSPGLADLSRSHKKPLTSLPTVGRCASALFFDEFTMMRKIFYRHFMDRDTLISKPVYTKALYALFDLFREGYLRYSPEEIAWLERQGSEAINEEGRFFAAFLEDLAEHVFEYHELTAELDIEHVFWVDGFDERWDEHRRRPRVVGGDDDSEAEAIERHWHSYVAHYEPVIFAEDGENELAGAALAYFRGEASEQEVADSLALVSDMTLEECELVARYLLQDVRLPEVLQERLSPSVRREASA